MDKLRQLSIYSETFRSLATQLNTLRDARDWMESGTPAEVAAQWATLGYRASEAAPLISQGVTPETAGEMDRLATDIAGGSEQRAMETIDRLVDEGVLIPPHRVRQTVDPDDPTHIIVHIS